MLRQTKIESGVCITCCSLCTSVTPIVTAWFPLGVSSSDGRGGYFSLHSSSRDVKYPHLFPQSMYSALPGLLDGNPFSESGQLQVPDGLGDILEVLKEALMLLTAFQVHPDISLQLCVYLFFFINASLFNALMERGKPTVLYRDPF